jgi:kumamolisin
MFAWPVPDFEYFANTHRKDRPQLSEEDFAAKYGARPEEINRVAEFARSHGLTIVECNTARGSVIAPGTAAQMQETFAVTLSDHKHEYTEGQDRESKSETYRGRDGFINVPAELFRDHPRRFWPGQSQSRQACGSWRSSRYSSPHRPASD